MPLQNDAQQILKHIQESIIDDNYNGQQALNAWGAHDFKASEASDKYGLSWVTFKVNALKHQGWVRVAYRGGTNYTVSLEKFSNSTAQYSTISVENTNAINLGKTIDIMVEGSPAPAV